VSLAKKASFLRSQR